MRQRTSCLRAASLLYAMFALRDAICAIFIAAIAVFTIDLIFDMSPLRFSLRQLLISSSRLYACYAIYTDTLYITRCQIAFLSSMIAAPPLFRFSLLISLRLRRYFILIIIYFFADFIFLSFHFAISLMPFLLIISLDFRRFTPC